jgi:hypothetical protein
MCIMGGSVRRSRFLSLLTRTGEEPMLDCRRCRIVDGRNRDAFQWKRSCVSPKGEITTLSARSAILRETRALLLQRQYWTRQTPLSDDFRCWRRYLRGGVPGVRSVWARNSTSAGSRLGGHVALRIGRRSPSSTTRHERICAPDSPSVSRISSSILGHPGSLE